MDSLTVSQGALTVGEVKAQVNLIQQVLEGIMKENVHYGKIPGCGNKLTLFKAGAEKIMTTFKLASDPQIEDLSTNDEIRYRITARILTFGGDFVGAGIGECSSSEEKYKWRKAVCQEEFDETPEDRRRDKWVKPWQKQAYQIKQIRTNIADVANTILKMAKKRALVDAVLTATASSDIFDQDLEDMSPELINNGDQNGNPNGSGKPPVQQPQSRSQQPGNDKYKQMLNEFAKAKKLLGEEDYYFILGKFGVQKSNNIKTIKLGNEILAAMKEAINQK